MDSLRLFRLRTSSYLEPPDLVCKYELQDMEVLELLPRKERVTLVKVVFRERDVTATRSVTDATTAKEVVDHFCIKNGIPQDEGQVYGLSYNGTPPSLQGAGWNPTTFS